MHLLSTGIPATGKTDIGDHLHGHYGFVHLDFEALDTLRRFWSPEGILKHEVRAVMGSCDRVVISWGFVVQTQTTAVLELRTLGFTWVWFDGHRDEALQIYLDCGREVTCWDRQMASVQGLLEPQLPALGAVVVDPRDHQGKLRDRDEIVRQLMGVCYLEA